MAGVPLWVVWYLLWSLSSIATLFGFRIAGVGVITCFWASGKGAFINTFLYMFGMTLGFYVLKYILGFFIFSSGVQAVSSYGLAPQANRYLQEGKMDLKYMQMTDRDFVMGIDSHVNELQYKNRVYTKTGYIIWANGRRTGLLHYSVLWDNLPFLNLIYVAEPNRNQGIGSQALKLWEEDMKVQGYKMVLLSTQVDENAQHFYRKSGYIDCGALLMNGTPFEQPMEMFMRKIL